MVFKDHLLKQTASGGHVYVLPNVAAAGFFYPKPIAFYVPKNVKDMSKIMLYLHGHRGPCGDVNYSPLQMLEAFDMIETMDDHASDTVLVFPISTGTCTTFEDHLIPQFKSFLHWLTEGKPAVFTLAGHSGAYRSIASILTISSDFVKSLKSLILLDAMYTTSHLMLGKFVAAGAMNQRLKVFIVYRKGSGTDAGSRALKGYLKHTVVIEFEVHPEACSHCKIPNKYLPQCLSLEKKGE